MRAYLAIKYHGDMKNKRLIENICGALAACGFKTCCIVRDKEAWGEKSFAVRELMAMTFREIEVSDVVVVDLTEKGVGVGIEAGYACALGIPVITIAGVGADISVTLEGVSKEIFMYKDTDELIDFFKRLEVKRSVPKND